MKEKKKKKNANINRPQKAILVARFELILGRPRIVAASLLIRIPLASQQRGEFKFGMCAAARGGVLSMAKKENLTMYR